MGLAVTPGTLFEEYLWYMVSNRNYVWGVRRDDETYADIPSIEAHVFSKSMMPYVRSKFLSPSMRTG